MKKAKLGIIVTAGIIVLCAGAAGAQTFKAKLTGDAEVDPVATSTSGKAKVRFKGDVLKFWIKLRRAEGITQAHIHCAPEGSNGPIVAFLAGFHERGWDIPKGRWVRAELGDANVIAVNTNGDNQNTACPDSIADLEDLLAAMEAGNTYVNVHSIANRGGEVRGQLR